MPAADPCALSRSARLLVCAAGLALTACGDKGSDSNGDSQLPDLEGHYNVIVQGTTGCEGVDYWITGWANGPLKVEGSPTSLTFDFGDGMSFVGGVDKTGAYSFAGEVTYVYTLSDESTVEATLDVLNAGRFTWDAATSEWKGEGDFTVEVDDDEFTSNNCTITAPIVIDQI